MSDDVPSDYGTIKIPREDFEEHNARRQDMGQTWAEYLDGQAPDPNVNAGDVATEITAQLNLDTDDAHAEIDRLREEMEAIDDELPSGLDRDDVRSACREAVREVLEGRQ